VSNLNQLWPGIESSAPQLTCVGPLHHQLIISTSLTINRAYHICRSVCLSVRKVYCGKMAEWIRIPFGRQVGSVEWWVY